MTEISDLYSHIETLCNQYISVVISSHSSNTSSTIHTNLERNANKVTSISASSTDTQYPSAKCVYDYIDDIIGDADDWLTS